MLDENLYSVVKVYVNGKYICLLTVYLMFPNYTLVEKYFWQRNNFICLLFTCSFILYFLCLLVDLGICWGLSTILKTSNKILWNNVFWRLKVYIFWKFIQYTIHWNKAQIVKKIPFKQNKRSKKWTLLFLWAAAHQFYF